MHKNLSSGLCLYRKDVYYHTASSVLVTANAEKRAHPDLNQGPADLQSAALTTELCTQWYALDICIIQKI